MGRTMGWEDGYGRSGIIILIVISVHNLSDLVSMILVFGLLFFTFLKEG